MEEERRAKIERDVKVEQQKELNKQKELRDAMKKQKQENDQMKEFAKRQYEAFNTSGLGHPGNGDMFE